MSSMRRSAVYAAITEHNMLVADLEEAQAIIARVRKWHAEHCDECNDTGPCPTIRAIEGELT